MNLQAFRPLPTLEPDGAPTGGSILADAAAAASAPPPPPAPGSAQETLQGVVDGPPEWAPSKYWDAEKKAVRVEDLGKGYKNLEQLLGREKVPVPASDDDQEGWERWFTAHGRPEKAEEYEFKRPEQLPEDLPYDDDLEKGFRDWAHQNGLNKKQAANAYDWWVKNQIDRTVAWHQMQKENRANAETALRRELGGKYEGWLQQTGALYKQYADPEFAEFLNQTGMGNDPRMIRFLGRIAQDTGGDTKLRGRAEASIAPADIDRAISEHRAKYKDALWNSSHPDNQKAALELQKLYEMKYPADSVP
jgi:hypothetical protein